MVFQESRRILDHGTIYTGWWFQPLGIILVSWDYYSQYIMENPSQWEGLSHMYIYIYICYIYIMPSED